MGQTAPLENYCGGARARDVAPHPPTHSKRVPPMCVSLSFGKRAKNECLDVIASGGGLSAKSPSGSRLSVGVLSPKPVSPLRVLGFVGYWDHPKYLV